MISLNDQVQLHSGEIGKITSIAYKVIVVTNDEGLLRIFPAENILRYVTKIPKSPKFRSHPLTTIFKDAPTN